jgi:hypothetical protein
VTDFTAGLVEIEFTPGTWTDVTPWYLLPVTIRQGRATPFEDVSPGVLKLRLDNSEGRFTPESGNSPYFPNVVEGKRIRFSVIKSAVTYPRFHGFIQAWDVDFPGQSMTESIVTVTATDGLGLMAQRRMRSNVTEIALWRGRVSGLKVDAFEASGQANGFIAQLTNYSADSAKGGTGAAYSGNFPTLQFAQDDDLSAGGVVTANPDSNGDSCQTILGLQSGVEWISFMYRTPTELLTGASVDFGVSAFYTLGTATMVYNLRASNNGTLNGLWVQNSAGTLLGLLANLPYGQWVRISLRRNSGTPTSTDWVVERYDGSSNSLTTVGDLRTVREVWWPGQCTGASTRKAPGSWAGLVAWNSRAFTTSDTDNYSAERAAAGNTVGARTASLANSMDIQGVTLLTFGTTTQSAVNGLWSGRTALDIGQEIARTANGILWHSPDDIVTVYGGDLCRPEQPLITCELENDTLGSLNAVRGVDQFPTRVEVVSTAARYVTRDVTLDGQDRTLTVSSIHATAPGMVDLANTLLVTSKGLRLSKITLDLSGASTDFVPLLFDPLGLGGLFPTARIRIQVPPSHFGVNSLDAYVQGWTETYDDGRAYIEMDLTPAATPAPTRKVVQPTLSAAAVGGFNRTRTAPPRPILTSHIDGGFRRFQP